MAPSLKKAAGHARSAQRGKVWGRKSRTLQLTVRDIARKAHDLAIKSTAVFGAQR